MKLRDKWKNRIISGDWEAIDDCEEIGRCPVCGAERGQQCNYSDEDGANEVSNYIHSARKK